MLSKQDYQEIKATASTMEKMVGKENTLELLGVFAEWSEVKNDLLREFMDRYREELTDMSGNMADIILDAKDKLEYNRCIAYIVDCYHRMAGNRDKSYRDQQFNLAGKMLDRMTGLLEEK